MKAYGFVCSLLAGALLSCSSTPSVIPARNLERPSDMGMVCLALDKDTGLLSGRPMNTCHPSDRQDPKYRESSSSRRLGTFALVSNTARGEMAVVDLDQEKLIDLDPVVFGFNMVQVGSMPENLSASPDGCWVASANRVSCDIGLVDPSRLLSPLFPGAAPSTGAGSPVRRLRPTTASGRQLQVAPKEIVFLRPDLPLDQAPPLCSEQPSLALVSFPSCDLVALMEFNPADSGGAVVIKDSVYVRSNGIVSAGAEPICPVDYCVEADPVAPNEDAGAPEELDGGAGEVGEAGVSGSLGVGALVLRPDRPTVYVGANNDGDFVAVLNVVGGKLVDGGRIALEAGAIGITHLRLSADPWKTPSPSPGDMRGSFIGTRGEFLYAFAQDGSVRVVDVKSSPGRECDVNIRPELLDPAKDPPINAGCFPVDRAKRQPLARGPGIRVPALPSRTAAPPIPNDITVVDLPADPAQINKNPQALAGQFAFLLASNSYVYVLNLSPHGSGDQNVEDLTMTHSFRETRATGQSAADMLTLVTTPPLRAPVSSDLLFPTTPLLSSTSGPRLERVTDTTPPAVPVSTNYTSSDYYADFPNQSREVSSTISIAWEDLIPNTSRKSGKLAGPSPTGPAGVLDDQGADFCGKGVLAGDLVVLPGCADDTDCNPQELYSCYQAISGTAGLCLPVGASRELQERCARFSGSRRRYEILDATPTQLSLRLHLDEVPKTIFNRAPLVDDPNAPHSDAECQPTEAHKASGTRLGFSWQKVWPNENFRRCVEPCAPPAPQGTTQSDPDRGCRPGFVCEPVAGALSPTGTAAGATGYCVEAPALDSECWPQPGNTYHVNAGTSFWVSGNMLPDMHPAQNVDGHCQPANRDLLVNRIPLSAPECTTLDGTVPFATLNNPEDRPNKYPSSTAVALFGLANSSPPLTPKAPYSPISPPGPNPCVYQDINRDEGATPSATPVVKAIFQNPEMRFVLTNLDQYAGDSLVTRVSTRGGFMPMFISVPSYDVALTQPIRIFTGPAKLPDSPVVSDPNNPVAYPYVYVLDQGRTALTPGSRGQIVRINARKGDSALATMDPASGGTQPFQIQ